MFERPSAGSCGDLSSGWRKLSFHNDIRIDTTSVAFVVAQPKWSMPTVNSIKAWTIWPLVLARSSPGTASFWTTCALIRDIHSTISGQFSARSGILEDEVLLSLHLLARNAKHDMAPICVRRFSGETSSDSFPSSMCERRMGMIWSI